MIGYFKEEIFEEDPADDLTKGSNKTVNASSKVMMNPRDLFTKDFIKMGHPKV